MNYSRKWRVTALPHHNQPEFRVPVLHHFYILVWTTLLSLSSFLYDLFPNFKTAFQWHDTYLAWATIQGQLPYLDNISRSGFFYHALSSLSQYFGGSYLYLLAQAVCLYLAGLYLYRLLLTVIKERYLSLQLTVVFYLLNLAFGLGGSYPMQLATPFVLMGLLSMATYLQGKHKDEGFITYGLSMALAVGFEPRTLIFWLLSSGIFLVINVRQKLWGRAVYQFLATIFGILLLVYPAAYFILNFQILLPYLEQTLLGLLPRLTGITPLGSGLGLVALLASGLLTGLLLLPRFFGKIAEQKALVVLLSLSTVSYTLLALLTPTVQVHDFLLILPFGLPLTALAFIPRGAKEGMSQVIEEETSSTQNRRTRGRSGGKARKNFLTSHAFLPLVVVLAGLSLTAFRFTTRQGYLTQSLIIANYLKDQSLPGNHLAIWDERAHLYLDSKHLSATAFPVAGINTQGADQEKLFLDQLLQDRASYVLVNKSIPLPEGVEKVLADNYQPVSLEDVDLYTLYQLD